MYKFLGSEIYPQGWTYSGPATEVYYAFYTSKDFSKDLVYDHIIENSYIAAGEEGGAMLTNKVWLDETGINNYYSVKFNARGPGISAGISGISFAIPVWVGYVILASIIAFTVIYTVRTVRAISYSPSGGEMWSAIKWVGIGVATAAIIPLFTRILPKRTGEA